MTGKKPTKSRSRSKPQSPDQGGGGATFNFNGPANFGQLAGRDMYNYGSTEIQLTSIEQGEVIQQLSQLQKALDALNVSPQQKTEGKKQIQALETQLTSNKPNAEEIKRAGDTLVEKIPKIVGTLVSLFASPVVGKVVQAAGEVAVKWVKSLDDKKKAVD